MTAAGVLAGANMQYTASMSYPGSDSAIVGKSGSSADFLALVIPRAFSFPAFTWGMTGPEAEKNNCTWPVIRSMIAVPVFLYGTGVILIPAMTLNIAADR